MTCSGPGLTLYTYIRHLQQFRPTTLTHSYRPIPPLLNVVSVLSIRHDIKLTTSQRKNRFQGGVNVQGPQFIFTGLLELSTKDQSRYKLCNITFVVKTSFTCTEITNCMWRSSLVLQHPQCETNFLLMSKWLTVLLVLNRVSTFYFRTVHNCKTIGQTSLYPIQDFTAIYTFVL